VGTCNGEGVPAASAATLGLGRIWERRRGGGRGGDQSGVGEGESEASGWRSDEIGTEEWDFIRELKSAFFM
jgi:hypothetical protein